MYSRSEQRKIYSVSQIESVVSISTSSLISFLNLDLVALESILAFLLLTSLSDRGEVSSCRLKPSKI